MNKSAVLLLTSIGLTGIGSWIYFIALNLMIFNQTGSAAAVGLLYIIRPAAALLTSLWCGSLVDRVQKKRLMILLTLAQSLLVTSIALFQETLWTSYLLVFLLQMLSTVFQPASMSFTVQVIPPAMLQRFNAVRSLLDSGSFLLGPAIAGMLLMNGSTTTAIYLNAIGLLLSASLLAVMPFKEIQALDKVSFSIKNDLTDDWKIALHFRKTHFQMWLIYFGFTLFVVLQTAVDSLEVSFSKEVLLMSDSQYGLLVSFAGAGILIGSLVNIMLATKLHTSAMIGIGSVMTAAGYLIFVTSVHMLTAYIGVFLLGTALAFANTGFLTLIQKNIPVQLMGRVVSFFHFIESLFVIILTALFALSASLLSIRFAVVIGVLLMILITGYICLLIAEKKFSSVRAG